MNRIYCEPLAQNTNEKEAPAELELNEGKEQPDMTRLPRRQKPTEPVTVLSTINMVKSAILRVEDTIASSCEVKAKLELVLAALESSQPREAA